MKNLTLFVALLCSLQFGFSQQNGCNENRYFNTIFEKSMVTMNVPFGQNVTIGGNTIALTMDIYEPEGDMITKRPVIVLAHGGGFVDGQKEDIAFLCEDFARRGFVTATITYRKIDALVTDSIQLTEAVILAVHDMKAAIRYFREDAATSNQFRIDPDFIFAGGGSAGAVIANTAAYVDDSDDIPQYITDILSEHGGLEGNSSSNLEYSSDVQGVLNYSGSIARDHFIDAGEAPLYSFHTEFDPLVVCGYGSGNALPFESFGFGSCAMHEAAEAAGIKNKLYLYSMSEGHANWNYPTLLYESAQFLGEILCENRLETPWEELGSGLDERGFMLFDISVVNEDIIWAIPTTPTFGIPVQSFAKSLDGGKTWIQGTIPVNDATHGVVGIHAYDDQIAWVMVLALPGQRSGKIYKTEDGGTTWTVQSSSFVNPNEGPQTFHFFNDKEGVALGHLWTGNSQTSTHVMYLTQDGGDNWSKLGQDVYPYMLGENLSISSHDFMEARGDHLWFGTSTGRVFHSPDKGYTWEVSQVTSLVPVRSVAFKDEMNGIALGRSTEHGNKAFATADGGQTWTEIDIPDAPRANNIHFVKGSNPGNNCGTYIIYNGFGTPSGAAASTDDGQTWELVSEQPVFTIASLNPETILMGAIIHGSASGGLYKWAGASLSGSGNCLTSTRSLQQESISMKVYPNPVADTVHIALDNDWSGKLKLQIVDSIGRTMYTKQLEKLHQAAVWTINVEELPQGVHYLTLSNGEKILTKRVVSFSN